MYFRNHPTEFKIEKTILTYLNQRKELWQIGLFRIRLIINSERFLLRGGGLFSERWITPLLPARNIWYMKYMIIVLVLPPVYNNSHDYVRLVYISSSEVTLKLLNVRPSVWNGMGETGISRLLFKTKVCSFLKDSSVQ